MTIKGMAKIYSILRTDMAEEAILEFRLRKLFNE